MAPPFTTLTAKAYVFTNTRSVQFSKYNTSYYPGYKISTLSFSLAFVSIRTHKTLAAAFLIDSLKLHEKKQRYCQFFVGNWINKPCSLQDRDKKTRKILIAKYEIGRLFGKYIYLLEDNINTDLREIVNGNVDWIYLGVDWLQCDIYKYNREFTRIPFVQGAWLRHWINCLRHFDGTANVLLHCFTFPKVILEAEVITVFQNSEAVCPEKRCPVADERNP
jgi:hypothetical protein